jgi:hypothetical protein
MESQREMSIHTERTDWRRRLDEYHLILVCHVARSERSDRACVSHVARDDDIRSTGRSTWRN